MAKFPFSDTATAAVIRDEFGASIDNSKEKLIDDDGMTKNNTEKLSRAELACLLGDQPDIVRT